MLNHSNVNIHNRCTQEFLFITMPLINPVLSVFDALDSTQMAIAQNAENSVIAYKVISACSAYSAVLYYLICNNSMLYVLCYSHLCRIKQYSGVRVTCRQKHRDHDHYGQSCHTATAVTLTPTNQVIERKVLCGCQRRCNIWCASSAIYMHVSCGIIVYGI